MEPVEFNEEVKAQPTSKALKMDESRSGFMCGLTNSVYLTPSRSLRDERNLHGGR